jgi:hypothetical protein
VQLNGHHPGTGGDERSGQGTRARADVDDQVSGRDAGLSNQPLGP